MRGRGHQTGSHTGPSFCRSACHVGAADRVQTPNSASATTRWAKGDLFPKLWWGWTIYPLTNGPGAHHVSPPLSSPFPILLSVCQLSCGSCPASFLFCSQSQPRPVPGHIWAPHQQLIEQLLVLLCLHSSDIFAPVVFGSK